MWKKRKNYYVRFVSNGLILSTAVHVMHFYFPGYGQWFRWWRRWELQRIRPTLAIRNSSGEKYLPSYQRQGFRHVWGRWHWQIDINKQVCFILAFLWNVETIFQDSVVLMFCGGKNPKIAKNVRINLDCIKHNILIWNAFWSNIIWNCIWSYSLKVSMIWLFAYCCLLYLYNIVVPARWANNRLAWWQ